jgi:hypothetical protein
LRNKLENKLPKTYSNASKSEIEKNMKIIIEELEK